MQASRICWTPKACCLMAAVLASPVMGQTVVAPFDEFYTHAVVGHPPLPNQLGALAIRPSDPDRVLIVASGATPEARVWSMGLIRDRSGHIVGLASDAPKFEFSAGGSTGGAFGSLLVMPNDGVIFSTPLGNEIGQVAAGETSPGLLVPAAPFDMAKTTSILRVPDGWCNAGRLLFFSSLGGQVWSRNFVVDLAFGYVIFNQGVSMPFSPPSSGAVAIPTSCEYFGALKRRILVCQESLDRVTSFRLQGGEGSGSLPDPQTEQLVLLGVDSPRGVAADPVTGDMLLISRDASRVEFPDRIDVLRFAPTCQSCVGDLNDSGSVDAEDLALLLGTFGEGACPYPAGDLNVDGLLDAADLAILLGSWGSCNGP
ncbi:MAG: hypothetical protein JNL80_01290 [Phycisphaerae bacterium]|jgi:hypothetical protein|nr:hypothetical protein [Phycisphaerae bacterium]